MSDGFDQRLWVLSGAFLHLWEARFRAAKLVPMLVSDAYENGHGRLVVKAAGALPVVNAHGPEFDRGELHRHHTAESFCVRRFWLRIVGKSTIPTPWTGTAVDFRESSRLCVPKRIEAAWLLIEGEFTYFRAEVTSLTAEC